MDSQPTHETRQYSETGFDGSRQADADLEGITDYIDVIHARRDWIAMFSRGER